jgi:uncharacterized membrane protein (DUF106 family)
MHYNFVKKAILIITLFLLACIIYYIIAISNEHLQMLSYVLKHHFINTIHKCNMFQHLKGHLQGTLIDTC